MVKDDRIKIGKSRDPVSAPRFTVDTGSPSPTCVSNFIVIVTMFAMKCD